MKQSDSSQEWFAPLFRLAGYSLLALSLLDLLGLFIPFRFTDPGWEFQLANQLVDRVPVPLIGLVLVLVGEQNFRFFKFLSWASVVAAVLFFLLIPLAISSAWRIQQQNDLQFSQRSSQIQQRTTQIQQLKTQLNKANTPEQITQVLRSLNPQNAPLQIRNPEAVKKQVLAQIAQAEQATKSEADAQANNSFALIKNAVRLVLGSLISGTIFLTIWGRTRNVIKASKSRA